MQRAGVSPSILNGLVEKKIFEIYYHEIGRLNGCGDETFSLNPLNEHQQRAYAEIPELYLQKSI